MSNTKKFAQTWKTAVVVLATGLFLGVTNASAANLRMLESTDNSSKTAKYVNTSKEKEKEVNDTENESKAKEVKLDLEADKAAGIAGFCSGGWSYPAGQCTSFVAGILASHNIDPAKFQCLGNASTWGLAAQARGVKVDLTPKAGAVVSFGNGPFGHVAYIARVNDNGSFHIFEGNFSGLAFNERDVYLDGSVASIIHFEEL